MGELVKIMKQLTSKACVSSTRNGTFSKRALPSACFVYAKRYFQKAGRFSSTRNTSFFENCALVYAKHYFFSARLAGLGAAVPMRRLTIPQNVYSRLRETLLFKNVPLQVLVSSTRNATLKKQVASRLCETLLFLKTALSSTRNTTFSPQGGWGSATGHPVRARRRLPDLDR